MVQCERRNSFGSYSWRMTFAVFCRKFQGRRESRTAQSFPLVPDLEPVAMTWALAVLKRAMVYSSSFSKTPY